MNGDAQPGDWVRIHLTVMRAGERAPGLPPDTAAEPYQAWINGWAVEPGRLGDEVEIRTAAGRRVRGRLVEVRPGYFHTFGRPHPVMLPIGQVLRRLLGAETEE